MPQVERGFGHRISPKRPKNLPSARGLLGAHRGLSPSAALSQFASVRDQGQAGSCVGFALAQAIFVRAAKLGAPIEMPSQMGIYYVGRAFERRQGIPADAPIDAQLPRLEDNGSDPVLAAQGIQEIGACSDIVWPYDAAKVTDEATDNAFQAMAKFTMRDVLQATGTGANGEGLSSQEAAQAIDNGFPFAMGIQCDTAWMNYGPDSPPLVACDPKDQQGGHMTLLLDYGPEHQMIPQSQWTTPGGSALIVKGINSWGTSWGQNGFYVARPAFIEAPTTGDGLIFDAVPGVTQKMVDAYAQLEAARYAAKAGK